MSSEAKRPILPPRLRPGDVLGLAAPAGPIAPEVLRQGIELLEGAGLKLKYAPDLDRREAYLAGTDERRLAELHRLWDDDQVKAILAVRGGYGCARLLSGLDFDLIARKPKILLGFSDLTTLLNAISRRTGLVTYHGPLLSTLARDGRPALLDALNALAPNADQPPPLKGLEVLRPGRAQGPLLGGNLTCLVHLLATPYEPELTGAILLLEDINEPAYRLDRMLTQLGLSGRLDRIAGVILGEFLGGDGQTIADLELIWRRVLALTRHLVPVWANFPVGHGPRNILLPIGLPVMMDSDSGRLRLLDAGGR